MHYPRNPFGNTNSGSMSTVESHIWSSLILILPFPKGEAPQEDNLIMYLY
jgi:hypothetical protein